MDQPDRPGVLEVHVGDLNRVVHFLGVRVAELAHALGRSEDALRRRITHVGRRVGFQEPLSDTDIELLLSIERYSHLRGQPVRFVELHSGDVNAHGRQSALDFPSPFPYRCIFRRSRSTPCSRYLEVVPVGGKR